MLISKTRQIRRTVKRGSSASHCFLPLTPPRHDAWWEAESQRQQLPTVPQTCSLTHFPQKPQFLVKWKNIGSSCPLLKQTSHLQLYFLLLLVLPRLLQEMLLTFKAPNITQINWCRQNISLFWRLPHNTYIFVAFFLSWGIFFPSV